MFGRFGVRADRLRLILPHAFPAAPPAVEWPDRLREFLDGHSPVLATAGGLEPEYDLALQIEALGKVLERHPRAGLAIAGGGSRHAELRALVASKRYGHHVLLYGDMPYDVTLKLIARADAFLRTTLYDGDAISVREALHFGTPVIATENGMRPEGVTKFAVGDLAGLVQAIERQLAAPRPPFTPGAEADTANLREVLNLYSELTQEI